MPPSPALSTQSSVHFMTSTALRENRPGDVSTPLALPSRKYNYHSHSRWPLNTAITAHDEGTIADHDHPLGLLHLYPPTSGVFVTSTADTLNSPTPTHVGSASEIGDSEKRKQKKAKRNGNGSAERTLDPTPFAFEPYHLASLVDPKNLDSLEAMDGIAGLLAGLGVDSATGLDIGGKGAPIVTIAAPTNKGFPGEGAAYAGTPWDRQRVYGPNILPIRKSKSLLELMWLALKDKVLVSASTFG